MKEEMPRLIPAHIRALLTRTDRIPYTDEETRQLEAWYEQLQLDTATFPESNAPEEEAVIWQRIQALRAAQEGAATRGGRLPGLRPWIWKAAVAAVCIGMGWYAWQYIRGHRAYDQQLATATGSVRKMVLPDGSQVWLNADSRLRYSNRWQNGKAREVELTGEAYFDIARKAGQPFIIHTRTVDIRVLGTSFNVKAYPDDAATETTLLSGRVEVVLKEQKGKTIQLQPREKLTVANLAPLAGITNRQLQEPRQPDSTVHITAVKINPQDSTLTETLWREGQLAFSDETFGNIALKLERWYGVTVTFRDERLRKARFTGTFRQESLQRVMEVLQISAPFHFEIKNSELIIDQ